MSSMSHTFVSTDHSSPRAPQLLSGRLHRCPPPVTSADSSPTPSLGSYPSVTQLPWEPLEMVASRLCEVWASSGTKPDSAVALAMPLPALPSRSPRPHHLRPGPLCMPCPPRPAFYLRLLTCLSLLSFGVSADGVFSKKSLLLTSPPSVAWCPDRSHPCNLQWPPCRSPQSRGRWRGPGGGVWAGL